MNIPIARPHIGDEEKQAVLEVLSSGQLSQGPKVAEFERAFAAFHGARFGVATSSGTTALTCALMAHGIGPGDEVIVPSFTFFATASSVVSVGATPAFVDIDPATFCMCPRAAEAAISSSTKAILPVHLYGQPADMPRFEALCRKHGLALLEDAAQAHGAAIGQRRVGTWGTAAFSFFPSKNMTTTEGGMVLTDSEALAARLRMIRHQGMNVQYRHEIMGYNFRMTEVEAAIGLVQLRRLSGWLRQRRDNAAFFDRHLRHVTRPRSPVHTTHVYNQYTVRVPAGLDRDVVVRRLSDRGIGVRVYYPLPIHRQPVFLATAGRQDLALPHTEQAAREVFSLPVHPALSDAERSFVVEEVNAACSRRPS